MKEAVCLNSNRLTKFRPRRSRDRSFTCYSELRGTTYQVYAYSKSQAYHVFKNYLIASIGHYDNELWERIREEK